MRIGRVTGSLTATIKEAQLAAIRLLVVDIEDGTGNVIEAAHVAVDTLGAGTGDLVLLTTGSAARIPTEYSGLSVDASIVAIVDNIHI
ncbi:MAG: ethanolamine utilization protein EutN [Parasphingorhabdus sp.]|jgi:ethanolamine utilization protein EutN